MGLDISLHEFMFDDDDEWILLQRLSVSCNKFDILSR